MNDKFDELTKNMAQSVTRRGALKKFALGLTGFALAMIGPTDKAHASACKPTGSVCQRDDQCCSGNCNFGFGVSSRPKHGNCS